MGLLLPHLTAAPLPLPSRPSLHCSLLSADALWKAEEMGGGWGLFLEAAKGIQPKANAITSGCKQASERRESSFK